jgi:steroid delta-isomerase
MFLLSATGLSSWAIIAEMKERRWFFRSAAFILAFTLASAARSATLPAETAAQVETTIRAKLAEWETAYNAGDRKKTFEIWAPDLVGWYPGIPDVTYAQEKAALDRPAPSGPRATLHVQIVEVLVSGELAVVRDIWTETPPGGSASATTIPSFEVWRRQPEGDWKIARWISAPRPAKK